MKRGKKLKLEIANKSAQKSTETPVQSSRVGTALSLKIQLEISY
jgi:hypothetical protein